MLCITDTRTDPYWNLAAEEYLLDRFTEPVLRLWRNSDSVIIGRNQNASAEINFDFVKEHNVAVVRRLSGGGAVFHDLGNVNFTFIDSADKGEDSAAMFKRFTSPIIDALRGLGVAASLEGRNDLVIDGRKFSGNAMCIHKGRVLQHGTLLFSSSMGNLSGALQTRAEKFIGKAVKSNRSRVTNISEHLPKPMLVEDFRDYLRDFLGASCVPYKLSIKDEETIEAIAESKYRLDSWNFGQSPKSSFSKCVKLNSGLYEVFMDLSGGAICRLEIRGDYFFKLPTEEFCSQMVGVPHIKEKITDRLHQLPVGDYFCGLGPDELADLFF